MLVDFAIGSEVQSAERLYGVDFQRGIDFRGKLADY